MIFDLKKKRHCHGVSVPRLKPLLQLERPRCFWNRALLIRPSFEKSFGSVHQAISPIKTPKKTPSCLSIFVSKKRHQHFDPTTTPASFDSFQVFQVSPPFRDQRITPRRDSLSLRWQLPSFATWVELQHDGGFGGNWTHTLAIRWGFGWGWKGQISPKKEDDKWGHTLGVEGTKYPNFCSPPNKISTY